MTMRKIYSADTGMPPLAVCIDPDSKRFGWLFFEEETKLKSGESVKSWVALCDLGFVIGEMRDIRAAQQPRGPRLYPQ